MEKVGELVTPLPSIFDLAVAGILVLPSINNLYYQGSYFIFYSLFLFVLTTLMAPKRQYVSVPLTLFVLWAFAMTFARHNIVVVPESIINYYFNVSIMFEGFIYILAGVLLIRSIVIYSTNVKFLLFLIPIAMLPILMRDSYGGRLTMPAAMIISTIVWLWLNDKFKLASLLAVTGIFTALSMWHWIVFKFRCRPYIWTHLVEQIKNHPWVGTGFNRTLAPDNMVFVDTINGYRLGWIYRHNDFLSIGAYLGIIAMLLAIWYVMSSIKHIGKSIYVIPFLTIVMTVTFQSTMFDPSRAVMCLVIAGVCLKETYKEEAV